MAIRKRQKTWRCFHCDEVFRYRNAAWAHFGDDSYCTKEVPACIDPLRHDEKKRITDLREAQKYALDMENQARELNDRVDDLEMELDEFKSLTKCSTVSDLRMKLDSDRGRIVTAEALLSVFDRVQTHLRYIPDVTHTELEELRGALREVTA